MAPTNTTSGLISKLKNVLLRQRLVLFGAGTVLTIGVALAVWILMSLLANLVVLPVAVKLVILLAAAGTTLFFFVRHALARLFDGDIDGVAVALEEKNPDLKGRLVAAVQFARSTPNAGFSRDLVAVTREQALEKAAGVDFGEVVSFHSFRKTSRLFAGAGALALAILLIAPGIFNYAFDVYSNPTTEIAPPLAYRVSATPQTCEWVKYRDIKIGGTVVGQRLPDKAYIHHRIAGGNWQKTRVDLPAVQRVALDAGDSLFFGITMRQVNRSFDFFIEAGELETEIQHINVVDRPRVTGIHLSIFYPDYTGLDPVTIDENNGSFSAVVGSRVNMKVSTNLPMQKAEIVFDDSSRVPLSIDNLTAGAALVIDKSRAYRIDLQDHLGETNPDPIEFYVTAVPDEYPAIEVIRPGFDVNLSDEMILPLLVRIFDDFGFSSLVMKFQVVSQGRPSDEHVAVLHYSDKIKTEGEVEFNWDMDRLNLYPGDYVAYYFEVADNDVIGGPKISRSRQFIARLPSLDEILSQTEAESLQRINRTEDLIRTGKELSRRLKEAARKLESETPNGQKSDWQQRKELESITEAQTKMAEQAEQIAEQMEKSLEKMQENSLMSRDILEKLAEIQKLYEEVATEEMKEAQRQLMEALKQMDRQELQEAMDKYQLSQEEMMERLERTLQLLKRMQAMQKMESLMRKAEALAERQREMNERTESADSKQLPGMSPGEDDIRDALEQLKKESAELREMMKDAEMDQVPEAQKFAEAMEKTDADQDMQQMSKAMQQSQKQDAGKKGKQAHAKLMEMVGEMQQQLAAMKGASDEEIQRAMRRAIDHTTHLSQTQEEQIRDAQEVAPQSLVHQDLALSQQDLVAACGGLKRAITELGKQSPFVAAELQSLLGQAVGNMELAVQELEAKQTASAGRYQRESMVNLNKAATRLMESMEQQNECNNPKSCDKNMAQLEQLSQKQNQCNNKTQGMCDNPKPGSQGASQPTSQGEDYRQGLERLAGEQGAIRKSMEQLEKEFGGSRQILGRIKNIADEMKKVEEALMQGDVGPETTERQLKIYSRMMEAARSLQRKDFTERRRAASATEETVFMPPSLPAEMFDDSVQLEDRLRQFLGDSYPPQYEEQIKAYFRALLKASGTLPPAQPEQEPARP
ncbi:MAG: hypothetical protein KKA42_10355 [candidate division Zixibacteria bacterium]|nr:hypothetical protein [candidate division Zixibacteria bacterium]